MMAGRQEGDPQHAGEFLREVEERRKALHRWARVCQGRMSAVRCRSVRHGRGQA